MKQTFFKGVLLSDLKSNFIPGSVTTCIKEALIWKERISSNKVKGAAKHVRHGKSCIIKIVVDTSLFKTAEEFQRSGIKEHSRENCWMNSVKSKAQINSVVCYEILSEEDLSRFCLL